MTVTCSLIVDSAIIIGDLFNINYLKMVDSLSANCFGEIEIVKRGRGKVLLNNGYQYYLIKTYKNLDTIWRCKEYRSKNCNGSVTVSEVKII